MADIPFVEDNFSKYSQTEIFAYISKLSAYASERTDEKLSSSQFSPAENLVMAYFPQFNHDYQLLIDKGYMQKNGDFLKWVKSQKLLAEYFHNLKSRDNKPHWHDIENLFSEMNLAQAFQNSKNINQSKDYKDLLKDLKK